MAPQAFAEATQGASDPLGLLGISRSQSRILRYFALRPRVTIHGRELQRVLGLGTASMQRDLENLLALSALERFRDGRYVRYQANRRSAIWPALRSILGSTSDPTFLIRDALRDVRGLEVAFVFGSTADDTRRQDSDIDVFVVSGPNLDRRALFGQLAEVALLLAIEVNALLYTVDSIAERLGNRDHAGARFIRNVLEGPKRWVAGDPEMLRPLATAAGLRFAA